MLARLRISVPDRPGSLGRVTSALGSAGADIVSVDVLESEGGRALDDVFVTVRDTAHLQSVTATLAGLAGVGVVAVQQPVPPVTGHADLELATQVIGRTEGSLRVLVDGAPGALGADWAALISFQADGVSEVLISSQGAPVHEDIALTAPLRLAQIRLLDPDQSQPLSGAALMPIEEIGDGSGLGLLLVRANGPEYHRSELWRLEQLGRVLGLAVRVPV